MGKNDNTHSAVAGLSEVCLDSFRATPSQVLQGKNYKGSLSMVEKCVDWIKKGKKIKVVFTSLTRPTLTELGLTAITMSQILGPRMFVKTL